MYVPHYLHKLVLWGRQSLGSWRARRRDGDPLGDPFLLAPWIRFAPSLHVDTDYRALDGPSHDGRARLWWSEVHAGYDAKG